MLGAILGDIIGSPFEFDRGEKTKEFELFTEGCGFTDDTVMTVAVAEALLDAGQFADTEVIKENCIRSMKKWGQKYPYSGFGARFIDWVLSDDSKPYGSYGNGSAMRVSPAGFLYDSMERTREVARATAEVSHNHPEGIKGAEATAAAIFLARNGADKEEIAQYIIDEFDYDLSRTLDEIRPGYYHVENCMKSVPEAITAFLEGENYEDVIRNVVSIGGDTDTLGAIAGGIAEAYYGMKIQHITEAMRRIPEEMRIVVNRFADAAGREDWQEMLESELREAIAFDCSLAGADIPEDLSDELVNVYEKYLDLAYSDAMNNLGALYYTGRLGKVDYPKAVKYYTMAADKLHPIAINNLAYCYYYGFGVDKDYEKAYKLLTQGMICGDDESMYKLGDMYRNGQFVEKNEAMAGRLYKMAYSTEPLAERSDHSNGCKSARVGDVFYYGLDEEINLDAALHFYQEAELGLYEQIRNGDRYHNQLLEDVIKKQNDIRRKIKSELEK